MPTSAWAQNTISQFNVNFVVQSNAVHPEISWRLETTNTDSSLRTGWSLVRGTIPISSGTADGGPVAFTVSNPLTGTFVDTGVTTGARVTYTFTARNTLGTVKRTVAVDVPGPPGPPQGFTGRGSFNPDDRCLQVDLAWTELSGGAAGFGTITGYDIEAFSNGVDWWLITPAESDARVATSSLTQGNHWRPVDPVHAGTTRQYRHCFLLRTTRLDVEVGDFRYRIRAHNPWTEAPHSLPSPWSDELVVLGRDSAETMDPPQNFTITLGSIEPSNPRPNYHLTWNPGENNNTYDVIVHSYEVYQQVQDGEPVKIYTQYRHFMPLILTPDIVRDYRVERTTLVPGKTYSWYVVGVRHDETKSAPSARVTAGTPTAPIVQATGGPARARIDWHPGPDNGNGDNDVQWQISYRRTAPDSSAWRHLNDFGNRRTRSRDVEITTAGTHEFQLRAINGWGPGAAGRATATVTIPAPLATPTTTGTATITVDDTTFTLTGPDSVPPGTAAVYTLGGGAWPRMLGVSADSHPLIQVTRVLHSNHYPSCPFGTSQAIACVQMPRPNTHRTEAPPTSIVRYQPADRLSRAPEPFANGAQLRVRFATDPVWVGERIAVGFHPASTTADGISWDGVTGMDAADRHFNVNIIVTESPRPPHGVQVTVAGAGTYRVAWNAPSNAAVAGIERYEVYRQAGNAVAHLQESVLVGQRWSEWTPSDPKLVYRWYVQSLSVTGARSDASRTVVAGRPNSPIDVTAVGAYRAVLLTWSEVEPMGTTPVTGYRVEHSVDGVTGWAMIAENSGPTATDYEDSQLRGGLLRHYRVFTLRAGASSPPSNIAHATTAGPATDTTATAPQNLTATPTVSAVTLRWTTPADDGDLTITGYAIQQSTDGTTWQEVTTDTGTANTEYVHGQLDYISAVHYRVAAVNSAGVGYYSPVVQVTKSVRVVPPPADIEVESDYKSLTLRWPAVTVDGPASVRGYRVEYYATTTSSWRVLTTDTGSMATPSFTDADPAHPLQPGQPRRYRLRTLTDFVNGSSNWTEVVGRTRPLSPDFDANPGVGTNDVVFLFYALALADLFDPTQNIQAMAWRRLLLEPLVYPFGDAAGAGLDSALTHVQTLRTHGADTLGNLGNTPGVDADDALILYYAIAFPDTLGDGGHGGFASVRSALLTEPSGLTAPNDADLRAVLQRARIFLANH